MSRNSSSPDNSNRPQTVVEVLCSEVGASHPDGALQQIRTMKRLLRSHYAAQKKLQRYGIDGLGDAVSRVAALEEEVDALRTLQRRRAAANVAAIDEALDILRTGRERLRSRAQTATATSDAVADDVAAAREVIDAVETELNELRLELWLQQSSGDAPDASVSESTSHSNRPAPGAKPEAGRQREAARGDGASEPLNGDASGVDTSSLDETESLLDRLSARLDALTDR